MHIIFNFTPWFLTVKQFYWDPIYFIVNQSKMFTNIYYTELLNNILIMSLYFLLSLEYL